MAKSADGTYALILLKKILTVPAARGDGGPMFHGPMLVKPSDDRYPHRPRLERAASGARLALIEAGAGYGKSVLARQYADLLGAATVYVPLGPHDDDLTVLASSLRRAVKAARLSDLESTTAEAGSLPWVDRLPDGLADAGTAVLIVLDDAHHLRRDETVALAVAWPAAFLSRTGCWWRPAVWPRLSLPCGSTTLPTAAEVPAGHDALNSPITTAGAPDGWEPGYPRPGARR
jgi:hypothetical protein